MAWAVVIILNNCQCITPLATTVCGLLCPCYKYVYYFQISFVLCLVWLFHMKKMSDTAVPPTKFLIWNFYNDLCALGFIRIFQYKLSVMLLNNAACDIKAHAKVKIRSPAIVTHEK